MSVQKKFNIQIYNQLLFRRKKTLNRRETLPFQQNGSLDFGVDRAFDFVKIDHLILSKRIINRINGFQFRRTSLSILYSSSSFIFRITKGLSAVFVCAAFKSWYSIAF
jgi:hypothetical protein